MTLAQIQQRLITDGLIGARAKGQEGMDRAANNCGPEWLESALTTVRWFAKVRERRWLASRYSKEEAGWTIEEARLWAYAHDLPVAKSERAWGSVTQRALREGLIVKTGGYRATSSSNGSARALYRKA